jgi:hypothetical protein
MPFSKMWGQHVQRLKLHAMQLHAEFDSLLTQQRYYSDCMLPHLGVAHASDAQRCDTVLGSPEGLGVTCVHPV